MGLQVLRDIAEELQDSPFLTVMADETTDSSNQEQVMLIVHRVTEVHEEFLGLYHVASIDAATRSAAIKDILIRMNLSFKKLRGQCYNGASAMSTSKRGVAKLIQDLEHRALYTHCYGHALNLAADDALKQCKLMKDALEMTRETKLIRYSPCSDGICKQFKESLPAGNTPGFRVLCP